MEWKSHLMEKLFYDHIHNCKLVQGQEVKGVV